MKNTLILLVFVLAFVLSSCEKYPEVQYRYDINGNDSCRYLVKILDKNDNFVEYDSVSHNWCCTWLQTEPRELFISAINLTDTTPVTVAIYRDNVLLDSMQSNSESTMAILSGVY